MTAREFELKMKKGEFFKDHRVPEGMWTVIRVDGRAFRSFTEAEITKPFSREFSEWMEMVTTRLIQEFNGIYGFTQSDEVSILLPPTNQLFDREVEKLVSLSAAEASVEFTTMSGFNATFDSRLWIGANQEAVVDYFRWRQADAIRNSLSSAVYWALKWGTSTKEATERAGFAPKPLEKKMIAAILSGANKKELHKILEARGIDFDAYDPQFRKGLDVAWELEYATGQDPKTKEVTRPMRRHLEVTRDLPTGDAFDYHVRNVMTNHYIWRSR